MFIQKKLVIIATSILAASQFMGCAQNSNQVQERKIAGNQAVVTPYDKLKKQLVITKGQTYFAFMNSQVFPAMKSFMPAIDAEEKAKPGKFSDWQRDWRDAGQGVAIRIDANNYYFNLGYRDGANATNDILSGRSYGVSITGKQSDPSDLAYLTELGQYIQETAGDATKLGAFYDAIMKVILNCDTSGFAGLSPLGQAVATDFLAIYTAESARHIMIKSAPGKHPWEIDLAAATVAAVFVSNTGQFMQEDNTFIQGDVKNFWAKGTKGSGIGETRRGRKNLQSLIANFETTHNKALLTTIKAAYKGTSDDVIQDLFEYLNAPKGPAKIANESTLRDAFVKYVDAIYKDSHDIAQFLSSKAGKKSAARRKTIKLNPNDEDDGSTACGVSVECTSEGVPVDPFSS